MWSFLCENEVKILNAVDFVELSDNFLTIFPSGCTMPEMTYTLEFGYPSYPYSLR